MSEQGKRINIRKATLREWRREFARHQRAEGIAANATNRAVRGVLKPQKSDGIYRAMRAGRSIHMRERAESVADALRAGNIQIEPGKAQLVETRRTVVRGWLGAAEALRADGRDGLAHEVERYVRGLPPPQTERELIARALQDRTRVPYRQAPLAMTR
jgi:hypothetical protein